MVLVVGGFGLCVIFFCGEGFGSGIGCWFVWYFDIEYVVFVGYVLFFSVIYVVMVWLWNFL